MCSPWDATIIWYENDDQEKLAGHLFDKEHVNLK